MTLAAALIDIDSSELVDAIFDDDTRARLGAHVTLENVLPEEAEIAITGWGSPAFDAERLTAWPNLRAIVHAAGSVKRVVTPAVWERGIRVTSSAAANAVPVAEYTLAMVLLSAKGVIRSANRYRDARDMQAARPAGLVGAYGITVGIVGASRIGRLVLDLLRPFDVTVLVYDPSLSAAEATGLGATRMSLPDLLRAADVVSLHAPSLPETHHMIGSIELALMREGATLINTARGRLVDTDALVAEVAAGRLHAVLDVTDPEPLPSGHPLFSLDGVVLTPHIAGSMGNEMRRIGRHVADEVGRFVVNGDFVSEILRDDLARIA